MSAMQGSDPGSLWIWGLIEDGRMGINLSTVEFKASDVLSPVLKPTFNPNVPYVRDVVCRASKTLALTQDGSIFAWGRCKNFSLGHGEETRVVARPKKIEVLEGINITQISAGESTTAAVSDEGDLYTWGWGGSFWEGNGGLGHGNNITQPHPALVDTFADNNIKIKQVSVGDSHMLALDAEGKVYSWGNGEYGRCGNGKRKQLVPEPVELLEGKKCAAVAAGSQFSLALTQDGNVYAWGKNDAGQLGLGGNIIMDLNTMEEYPLRVEVEDPSGQIAGGKRFAGHVVAIAAGGSHSLAITADGTVWQWGQRTFLQPSPVEYGYLKARKDEEEGGNGSVRLQGRTIAAGDGVSAVVDANGHLFTWGKNLLNGVLGHTRGFGTRLPTRVEGLHDLKLTRCSLGKAHGAAITQ